MRYHFQSAALLLQVILLLCWFIPRKLNNYCTRIFSYTLYLSSAAAAVNALFSYVCLRTAATDANLVTVLAKLVLVFSMWVQYAIGMYVLSDVTTEKNHKSIAFPMAAIPLVESLLLIMFEMKTGISDYGILFSGYCMNLYYAFAVLNVIVPALMLVYYRKNVGTWLLVTTLSAAAVTGIGVFSQMISGLAFLVPSAINICILIIFVALENPLNSIEKKYDCFKAAGIIPRLKTHCYNKTHAFAVFISISKNTADAKAEDDIDKMRTTIINTLREVPEAEVFISSERDIVILCSANELYDDFMLDISELVVETKSRMEFAASINTIITYIKDISEIGSADTIYRHLLKAKFDAADSIRNHVEKLVTYQDVLSAENEEKTKQIIIEALDEDRLEVFYQPIYSASQGRFTSAEALARIRNKDGTIMMPGQFISVAENTGLIIQVGERVLENVCKMLSSADVEEAELDSIDINLSINQGEDPNLAEHFISIVNKYNVNPLFINIEIAESGVAKPRQNLIKNITRLSRYGFKFSLDDFGSGTSNFNHLITMPVSSVKLDRFTVWNYFEDDAAKTLIRSIIDICHDLDIKVSATGIETLSQLNEMASINADYIQGYYFFKPMALEDFKHFLRPSIFEADQTKQAIIRSNQEIRIERSGSAV